MGTAETHKRTTRMGAITDFSIHPSFYILISILQKRCWHGMNECQHIPMILRYSFGCLIPLWLSPCVAHADILWGIKLQLWYNQFSSTFVLRLLWTINLIIFYVLIYIEHTYVYNVCWVNVGDLGDCFSFNHKQMESVSTPYNQIRKKLP